MAKKRDLCVCSYVYQGLLNATQNPLLDWLLSPMAKRKAKAIGSNPLAGFLV
jgi:hypothetical protein